MACPLKDAELELLLGQVAERLQQGVAKDELTAELVAEYADGRWTAEEVTAFVKEVDGRTQELGRPPRGCALLCQSAATQARAGLLFASAGALATGLSIPLDNSLAVLVAGSVLLLYSVALVIHSFARLKRYRS